MTLAWTKFSNYIQKRIDITTKIYSHIAISPNGVQNIYIIYVNFEKMHSYTSEVKEQIN